MLINFDILLILLKEVWKFCTKEEVWTKEYKERWGHFPSREIRVSRIVLRAASSSGYNRAVAITGKDPHVNCVETFEIQSRETGFSIERDRRGRKPAIKFKNRNGQKNTTKLLHYYVLNWSNFLTTSHWCRLIKNRDNLIENWRR